MSDVYQLYLIRHAIAEERGEAWPDDAKRPLTSDGIGRMRKAARGLASVGVTLDVVITSPLVRARQTAEIVAEALDPRPTIVSLDSLAPDVPVPELLRELEKHAKRASLALVGHEPGLGDLAARLIGARRRLEFKKGAVCRIDVDALPPTGSGELRWFLTPKMLRLIK